ncbi:hypothetical protein AKJ16_DCAP27290 [Drosera capensis]
MENCWLKDQGGFFLEVHCSVEVEDSVVEFLLGFCAAAGGFGSGLWGDFLGRVSASKGGEHGDLWLVLVASAAKGWSRRFQIEAICL